MKNRSLTIPADKVSARLLRFADQTKDSLLAAFARLLPGYLSGPISPVRFFEQIDVAIEECQSATPCLLSPSDDDGRLIAQQPEVYSYLRDNKEPLALVAFSPKFLATIRIAMDAACSYLDYFHPIL